MNTPEAGQDEILTRARQLVSTLAERTLHQEGVPPAEQLQTRLDLFAGVMIVELPSTIAQLKEQYADYILDAAGDLSVDDTNTTRLPVLLQTPLDFRWAQRDIGVRLIAADGSQFGNPYKHTPIDEIIAAFVEGSAHYFPLSAKVRID